MNQLVYPRDRVLTMVTLVLGSLIWVGVFYGVVALGGARTVFAAATIVLLLAAIGFVAYLFARSAAITHLQGNGIEVSASQFPELYSQFTQSCDKLSIADRPGIYVLNGNGVMNAFATWFLGRKYVVLLSSVVDAMEQNASGIRFYVGHELGHVIRHDNPFIWALRWPALRFPLLGAGFARARESSCDLHGLACSESREDAARSLLALSAGSRRWRSASLEALAGQLTSARGFWMSFHELTASYPWHAKRVLRVLYEDPQLPRRNPFAYVIAAFIPYSGKYGSGLGLLIYIYVIGVLAAIAIPAYKDYEVRTVLAAAVASSQPARDALASYYMINKKQPASLQSIGVSETVAPGISISLGEAMILTVTSPHGALVFSPVLTRQGRVSWGCSSASELRPAQLPASCR
jgi:Zn-dependent protease with chaperone function